MFEYQRTFRGSFTEREIYRRIFKTDNIQIDKLHQDRQIIVKKRCHIDLKTSIARSLKDTKL